VEKERDKWDADEDIELFLNRLQFLKTRQKKVCHIIGKGRDN
jgi:hypothetical protein